MDSPPSSEDFGSPATEEMKAYPSSSLPTSLVSKNKPCMTIPIPNRSYQSITQLNTPLSTTSSIFTPTWSISTTPNSTYDTPLTSGQITPSDSFFTYSSTKSSSHKRASRIHQCRLRQLDANGQPLDVLERVYCKPEEEIDIGEALKERPLKGTFRYALEKEKELEGKMEWIRKEQTNEQKRAEFERVKRALRGS